MSNIIGITQGAISQGVLWGIMAIGVFITFKLLDFPDLTVDGSFALGGATCTRMLTLGFSPTISILLSIFTGLLAGLITAFLNTKFKIPPILAGILTQLSLYSINLRIMGKPNIGLLQEKTLFKNAEEFLEKLGIKLSSDQIVLIIGILIVAIVIALLYWFFGTEIGCAIRATGHNPNMVRAQGQNTKVTTTIALMLSNAVVALSGALVSMHQGYGDVQMGIGAIVIGLAAIVIGEVIFSNVVSFANILISVVVGSVVYRLIIAFVLKVGLDTNDLKMFTAVIVSVALALPEIKRYLDSRKVKYNE